MVVVRRKGNFRINVDAFPRRAMNGLMRCLLGKSTLVILASVIVFLFSGCGGTDRRQPVNPAASRAPAPFIALLSNASTGTIHFPRGLYSLDSQDSNGYYYRAAGKVYQRSFAGGVPHDGGIFVSRRDQRKLRGYVIMPGGLTHVGNLSGADYQFRN